MKLLKLYIIAVFALFSMSSCSDDDSNGTTTTDPETNYFPSAVGNYWNYRVVTTDNVTLDTATTKDSLYVVSGSDSSFMLDVNDGQPATGVMLGLLASGTLEKTDNSLLVDGVIELPAALSDLIDFDIVLEDFELYNTDAAIDTELSVVANTITQDLNGIPLTINYELKSVAKGFQDTVVLFGTGYNDVLTTQMRLNLDVSTTITVAGFPLNLSILDAQDVLVSNNLFAKDVGMAQADSNFSYQISPATIAALQAAGVTLPIPESGSSSSLQFILNYSITL